ncbi:mechanosensitive ion channel [Arthrobacter alpinus]|uniref:mechanosensitive ion channel family protein n=1 Tax=Arthrobacter alpinus TaxID=656366 RepID=UPI001ED9B15D|nr:mechanosensitive ion channel domain-containing protein [Arthrobacter alpinus]MDD0858385.1 mechanosensitive ion channel [Arthrobacter alpinus]
MQAANFLGEANNTFLNHLALAGITIAIGVAVWLVLHYLIRIVVKRARADRAPLEHRTLRWAAPMLRNLDPVVRALENERRVQRARTIGTLLNSVLTIVVAVVTSFYVLIAFEIDIAPLLASVGVVGIAIGFGCQQLIRDFLAGIFIAIEDQYGIGDVIQTSEVIGTVEYVSLRITRVLGEDGTLWYLRNGEILRLGNRSKGSYTAPAIDTDDGVSPAPAADAAGAASAQGAGPASNLNSAPNLRGAASASNANESTE